MAASEESWAGVLLQEKEKGRVLLSRSLLPYMKQRWIREGATITPRNQEYDEWAMGLSSRCLLEPSRKTTEVMDLENQIFATS